MCVLHEDASLRRDDLVAIQKWPRVGLSVIAMARATIVFASIFVLGSRAVALEPATGAAGRLYAQDAATTQGLQNLRSAIKDKFGEATPPPPAAASKTMSKDIHFGMVAAMTGPAKELGTQMKVGITSAFDAANDSGGVNGQAVKLDALDDGYDPTRTLEQVKKLHDSGVVGLIGDVGTPTAAAVLPFALEHKMLFFGAFSGANLLRRDPPDRYVLNYRASYAEETDATVVYLVKVRRLKPEQIVVFAQQDSFGDSGYEGVETAVRALGGKSGTTRLNYQRNTVDVGDAVAALAKHKGVKAVVMVATYRAAAKFIEKTRDLYPDLIYTNVSFVGSSALAEELKLLGPKYAEGVIVTQVVPDPYGFSSLALEYRSAVAKYFPSEAADYVSFEGYVDGRIMIEALKRAGSSPDSEKLVETMEGIHDLEIGLGVPIGFGVGEHQAIHKVWGTRLDGSGHFVPIGLK
jgi:ABC-type branched-subunit amino acid transport system substrate-binding protein